MPSFNSPSYPLGGSSTERDRLLIQAEQYEQTANWLLDQIEIQPGWRTVDFGCGPIGVLNLLSQRVGPSGSVIGIEREARFVEMARAEVGKRGLGNVNLVQADGLNTGLEKGSFDFVHERLVLINVSAREAFVTEMLRVLRSGGTVALEDVDNVSWLCQPSHPSWDILLSSFHTVFHAGGGDGFIGRRLPVLLHAAGVENIRTRVTVETPPLGDYRRTHLIALIDSVRDKIVAQSILDETSLNEHRDALAKHLSDPGTTVIDKLFVQCWGQKPR